MYKLLALTEPVHLSQESTNNLLQNVTSYVIPESCANIVYSIVSVKRDAFHDAPNICKTRVTSVTVMGTSLQTLSVVGNVEKIISII